MNKNIRLMAIALLDDEDGICDAGWDALAPFLADSGNQDICNAVEGANGRYYLGEDDAEMLRQIEPAQ